MVAAASADASVGSYHPDAGEDRDSYPRQIQDSVEIHFELVAVADVVVEAVVVADIAAAVAAPAGSLGC